MTIARTALACLLALPAYAEPRFSDRSTALPEQHVYDGGWEHFVGGGIAVLDCDGDARPDLFAAGGANPARLYRNRIDGENWSFDDAGFEPLTGVTGAYPLDIDSDGLLDLAVLRVGLNHLYRGLGDCRFAEADRDWGFVPTGRWTTAFSATWEADEDWPTLAFGNYVDRDDPEGPFRACDANELYRNRDTGYGDPVLLEPGYCTLSMLFPTGRGAVEPTCGCRTIATITSPAAASRCTDPTSRAFWGRATAGSRSRSGAWGSPAGTSPATGDRT